MSIRHLESLFQPSSIALIGASDQPHSLGTVILRNLQSAGFKGPILLVNPKRPRIGGQLVWPDVASLPGVPDLAVICTPAATVPALIAELGAKGTRCAIIISAGLHTNAPDGLRTLQQAMLDAARPYLLRVLGPNCIGLIIPGIGLNASFAPGNALPGKLAFVTQSGALATAMLDWANSRNIGFSHFVSLGDSADVDFGDVLDYLACDASTRAILMYAESISSARKFMSAARQAARNKPVIVVKAGRASSGARAAASHTGALAGSDVVLDAAFRRAGMLRVDTLEALFDAAETLAHARPFRGERLAILTNGGGAGVLAADALQLAGGRLAKLEADTLQALNACLPPNWPHANPVDIIGDAPVERYRQALEVLLAAQEVDAVLFMHAPTAVVP
jgi:acetyltransferase